ncbi:protein NDRG3 isoform X1 [Macrosteles quadrilineatus]|uniref:protein NDRG3 isoform X1 n=3 Tax=Macrosteles quadrilineatus TaxID=74068 RepID=UPI0023E31430|nr:protein NDRG3 isoform X1 [Macrosteles quadrilineatus]XP_054274002.1 protein NDRG3 isoform X1 [Macrosteles quadrilineatus]
MPGGLGASYRSLADDVYKTTTIPDNKFSVVESVKKVFSFTANQKRSEPLIAKEPQPVITKKMPASAAPEETALLGTMPSDSMDDIELRNIQLQFPSVRSLSRDDPSVEEVRVETDRGSIMVAVQGNRSKPAILTYHDLGLNYVASFQAFFNYSDMRMLLENFSVYHVNAPGQEEGSHPLPDDYEYPTMDELANQLNFVLSHFGLNSVIGLGVGAGGNILARFALNHPNKVEALVLINVVSTQAGWLEWGYQKINARYLKSKGMTQGVLDYLMWHHFGRGTEERNHDLVQVYKTYFERFINPGNLAMFIDSYVRRTDLNMTRNGATLSMPVLNISGALSPHVDETVTLNSRLDPTNSSWMKISDCGMVLEEQPNKVSEALRLFLQGLGYAIQVGRKKLMSSVSAEGLMVKTSRSGDSLHSVSWPIHITENPISEAAVC